MGTNTLTPKVAGATIFHTDPNELQTALNTDFVGRNSSGVPTPGQNLGTAAIPWGTLRAGALVINGSSVDTTQVATPPYRVVSGATRAASNQPAFLVPNGSALSVIVDGTPTSLVYDVNGQSYTLSADITKSSLTAAPSSNNTCLVNDSTLADAYETRVVGENGYHLPYITIDTIGSEISALDGKTASFLLGTEIFICRVDTTNNRLINCRRGFFYNSSLAPLNRETIANNDTITLLKTGWLFLDSDGTTVDVTYNEPVYSFTSPASPATGDYWFDLGTNLWKRYDGASFQTISRTFIGWVANSSSACIGARCVTFDATFKSDDTIVPSVQSTEIVRGSVVGGLVSVAGNRIEYKSTRPTWNITTDLASSADLYSATEQASRNYYLYVSDEGEEIISDIHPYVRPDLLGKYHPHNPWRAIGYAFNNGSSNITGAVPFEKTSGDTYAELGLGWTFDNLGTVGTTVVLEELHGNMLHVMMTVVAGTTAAGTFKINLPGKYRIDTYLLGSANFQVGYIMREGGTTNIPSTSLGPFVLFYDGSTNNGIFYSNGTTAAAFNKNSGTANFTSGERAHIQFKIPVILV